MTQVRDAGAVIVAPAPHDVVPRPDLASFAEDLYDALIPLAWVDADNGYHLAFYCGAVGVMFQAVADVARDTADGPGWSAVVDVGRAPDSWLGWLAQFVGVALVPGTTPDEQRVRIKSTDGFRRGTVAAVRSAAQLHLTGAQEVIFVERFGGDAYALAIRTVASETPDAAQTLADIIAAKPAGLTLDYGTYAEQNYDIVRINYATYAGVRGAYASYSNLRANLTR